MLPSPGFMMRAPELIRDIHKNRLTGISALGILGQSYYDIYGPGWISFHGDFKNFTWARTCDLYRLNHWNTGPAPCENEEFLATYLLILAEACKLDIDQILEDPKNEDAKEAAVRY